MSANAERSESKPKDQAEQFRQDADQPPLGPIAELVDLVLHNKKCWLVPLVIILSVIGFLIAIGGGSTPFIYTLF